MTNNTLSGKTILLVNTGSQKKRFIIQQIKKLGVKLIVLNKEINWAKSLVDHWILADNTNHSEAITAVKEFLTSHQDVKIDGVLTFWEDDVLLTSKIVDKFNFIGVPYSIAKKTRNKYRFREFCQLHNIPTPKHYLIKKEDDLNFVRNNFNFPIVIKPAFGSSSAYVVRVDNVDELIDRYRYVRNNISVNVESALTDGLDILVEEFIDGDEVDIDILLQNGKTKFYSIADNYNKSKGIFFVDSGQAIPSTLPNHVQLEIIEMAEMTLEKLGIFNGCIHFEAKYSSRGFYPIEVNIRMGGDYVYSYNKSAWGIDLIEYSIKIACGEYIPKIHKPAVPRKYIIGWDLHPQESGILAELNSQENLKKNKHIEEVEIYKKIGDPILVPPEGFEHLGWLTVTGENTLDAKDNLEEILQSIVFKVVKFDQDSALGKTERKNRFSLAVLNKDLVIRAAKIKAIVRSDNYDLKNLKIGILCNINQDANDIIDKNMTQVALGIKSALDNLGYQTLLINLNNFFEALDILRKGNVDLVFNISEKLYGDFNYRPQITALLDSLQIPYTGSGLFTSALSIEKINFKKILDFHEIPTPNWDYVYEIGDEIDQDLKYPLVVKPSSVDYGMSLGQDSVVSNKKELDRQLHKIIIEMKQSALIEEYIYGDEYEVYILGNEENNLRVLPLSRSIFNNTKNNYPINSFDAKWSDDKSGDIIYQLPHKNISRKLESLITEIAIDTYNIADCKDYGKVEIKVDAKDNPYVIKINPLPWLYDFKSRGMSASAKLAGISFSDLLEEIIRLAVDRYKYKFENKIL